MRRAGVNRLSINSSCEIIWKRFNGTRGRPRRRCRPKSPQPPPRATWKPIACSLEKVWSLASLKSSESRQTLDSRLARLARLEMTVFDLIVLALVGASVVADVIRGLVYHVITALAPAVRVFGAARGLEGCRPGPRRL